MATIKYFRKSFTLHADGSRTDARIEESHNWPLLTCNSFKASFPDQVISITAEEADHVHKARGGEYRPRTERQWKKKDDAAIPLVVAALIDLSGAAAINAAVRAL